MTCGNLRPKEHPNGSSHATENMWTQCDLQKDSMSNSKFFEGYGFYFGTTCSSSSWWEITHTGQPNSNRTSSFCSSERCATLCPSLSSVKRGRSWWSATSKMTTLRKLKSWNSHLAVCVARLPWLHRWELWFCPLEDHGVQIWSRITCFGGLSTGIFTCCIVSRFVWIQKVV